MENLQTLSVKIDALLKKQEKQDSINDEIFSKLEGKVSYKDFWRVFSLAILVLGSILGFIAVEISQLRADEEVVKNQVSYINGIFKTHDLNVDN